MKIDDLNQKAVTHTGKGRPDRPEAAEAHGETVAKQQVAADKVELSGFVPVDPTAKGRNDGRVNQVAEIRTQVLNGSYNVPARAVAEKMLSKIVIGGSGQVQSGTAA